MAIKLFERRAMVAKVETTYGTDSTPAGASDSALVLEGSIQVEADSLPRAVDRAYLGADPYVLINRRATVTGSIELLGNSSVGTAAPIAPILRGCGHAETLTASTSAEYNPISAAFQSVTIYFEWAGVQFKVTGARGQLDNIGMDIDNFARSSFTFVGKIALAGITEATISGFTIAAFQSPVAIQESNFAVTIDGTAVNVQSVQLSQGQPPQIFHGSEEREISYNDRASTGRIRMFLPDFSDFNGWSVADAQTPLEVIATVNGGAGKITTLTIAAAQFGMPQNVNINGAAGIEIPYSALPSSGNDEYVLLFA